MGDVVKHTPGPRISDATAAARTAKELLALDPVGLNAAVRECARITAPEITDEEYAKIKADNSPRYRNTVKDMERVIRAYLSARQQASVEEVADFLGHCDALRIAGSANDDESELAHALLAKYDIFEKVEG